MMENTETMGQKKHNKGIAELYQILHSLQILEKEKVTELIALIHRDGRLDPSAIRDSWPKLYGFSTLEEMMECVARTYKLYLQWPKTAASRFARWGRQPEAESISESTLFSIASDLNFRNNFELFQEFDPDMQKFIAGSIMMQTTARDQNTIMSMMLKSGVHIRRVITNQDEVIEFFMYLKSCLRSMNRENDFEITYPDPRIVEIMKESITDPALKDLFGQHHWGPSKPTILCLFIMYYGQSTIIQVIDRLKTAGASVDSNTLMRILDNWQEMISYPAEWILQICSEE